VATRPKPFACRWSAWNNADRHRAQAQEIADCHVGVRRDPVLSPRKDLIADRRTYRHRSGTNRSLGRGGEQVASGNATVEETPMFVLAETALAEGHSLTPVFAFLPSLSPMELMIILIIGILLFGKRLPEVGRSLGKGIVEFKKGLRGVEDEIDEASTRNESPRTSERSEVDAPKFEIPKQPTYDKNDKPV
jgi:sec-independent protein translocase protein TatA